MAEVSEVREDTLLGLTALCGDLPVRLLPLLPGSTEWTRKTVSVLRADKLLRRHHKNGVPSLRLTQKGRTLLNRACPERFQPLFTESYLARCRKSDPVSVERLHRTAAVYLLMFRAGVQLYPDEKPPFYQLGNPPDFSVPAFYSSLEVKGQGPESTRIKATRAVGLLMGTGYAALVYHTGAAPLKWSSKAEQKLMGAVKGILIRQRIPLSEIEGLMIGANMGTALDLLQSDGGNRRQYFRLDSTFPIMRYLPCDENGIRLLWLLCRPASHKRLAEVLRSRYEEPVAFPFDSDVAIDGQPVLFAYDFDLERIKRFKSGLELFGKQGHAVCFDFQADCLERYLGRAVHLHLLEPAAIWKEVGLR